MKFLLMLLVLAFGLWLVLKRSGAARMPPPSSPAPKKSLPAMAECAHCGLHLPAADAVVDGTRVFCSEAHRLLGPRRTDGP